MKIKGCIHDGWLIFQDIDPKINKIFLLKLLNHVTKYFREIAPDGTQPNLNTGIMKNFSVILPGIEKQNRFSELVNLHQSLKQKMLVQSEELENQFQALMQKAFKGGL
jgi:type I restriction enzyme S subunit